MSRQRVSPSAPGTAERTLHDHYRKDTAAPKYASAKRRSPPTAT